MYRNERYHIVKNISKYIILLFLLFGFLPGYSLPSVFRGLSVTEGLSDLVVNALYKDSIGYVWIGTGNSLERFLISGANEKIKRVNAIAEMEGNQIWMGNGMGLWRVNTEKDILEPIAAETLHYGVRTLLPDGKGTLYIGSEAGLFIYKNGNLEQKLIDPNVLSASNIITGLSLSEDGILWIATNDGLYSLTLADKKIVPYHNIVEDKHFCSYNNITRIGNVLYLGTMGQGIISFDTQTHKFRPFIDVGCNVISSLSGDGKDMLYVGTDGNGVHFISTKQMKVLRSLRHEPGKDESIRSNSVYSLLVDRDGLIWIGFYQLGLDYSLYQSGLFSTYSYLPYFDSKDMPVRSIAITEHEKLVGSRDGLFYINEEQRRFKNFKSPELRSSMIFCIYKFQDKYYIGTYGGGMYIFNPADLTIHDFEPNEPQPFMRGQIFSIKADNKDQLWIGTSMGLYCYKDGKRIKQYTSANSKLPEGNVYEIYFDSTHKGWICTENGMCIWDPSSESLKTDIFPENFIHKEKIRVVYEDSDHNLYFLPDKGSMCISDLSMSRFRRLQPDTQLEGKDGMFILEDDEKWLWIGTNNGLYRYDKKETFIPYNFIDGIPSSIFTLCPPVQDQQGNIWMGNSKGLIYMNFKQNNQMKRYTYPLTITDIYVNGKKSLHPVVESGKVPEIQLESSQNNLTFHFSGFTYTEPAYMTYEYKLEGEDEDWQILTGKSEITYYDLSSGNYLFKLRYIGNPDSEVRTAVHIAYPVETWSIITVSIALAFIGYIYYQRKRKAKQTKNIQIQLPEDVQEPEKQEKTVELKYKTNKISTEECQRLTEKLEALMHRDKPYTNPDLKIADLATMLGRSAHTLSYLFNQHLNRNYYDYINDYRIEEFKRLINEDEYSKYTLGALAELCGFSSRASFFRYFKKATGITPNEYIRSIGKNNDE
jgi:ligand-binding sensor domain-containing protein/AraC-like DNA-binding protein